MRDHLVLDPSTQSGTDRVVTFPTKCCYYVPMGSSMLQVTALLRRNFTATAAADDFSFFNIGPRKEAPRPGRVLRQPVHRSTAPRLGSERADRLGHLVIARIGR